MSKIVSVGITYKPTPTGERFHSSPAIVRAVMGPTGGGKSSMCCNELYARGLNQSAFEGVRRTRFAIIRNTFPQLESTTIKTWIEWIPETLSDGSPYCVLNRQRPVRGNLKVGLADGTRVEMELHFLALDKEEDIKKLKSLEVTGVWINEASEVPKAVWDMALNRCDRYPPKRLGGCTWRGLILDTNPPDEDSDFYKVFEIDKPEGYVLFKQPPAIFEKPRKDKNAQPEYEPNYGQRPGIAKCENVDNHNSGYDYWMRQVHGKDVYWIKVFMQGEYGVTRVGKPVYENQYSDSFHCSTTELEPYRGLPLLIGQDFGGTPTCVIAQLSPRGQLRLLDEMFADNMGAKQFWRDHVLPFLRSKYRDMQYRVVCDPAGKESSQSNEISCMQELSSLGVPVEMARSNLIMPRLNAVRNLLIQNAEGQPKLLLSPRCKQTRAGFQSKYHFRKTHTSLGESYSIEPEKNHPWSDLQDCLIKGTRVLLLDGSQTKIEDVTPGMWLITKDGAAKVTDSWLVKKNAEVYEVITEDGASIIGTADHRVWANGKWIALDKLQYNDVLLCINNERRLSWANGQSNIRGEKGFSRFARFADVLLKRHNGELCRAKASFVPETATRWLHEIKMAWRLTDCGLEECDPDTTNTRLQIGRVSDCTDMSGKNATEKYQKECAFTTRTKTKVTTRCRILNFCLTVIICLITRKNVFKKVLKLQGAESSPRERRQKNGMDRPMDLSGTRGTLQYFGRRNSGNNLPVPDVERNIRDSNICAKKDSVPRPVSLPQDEKVELTTNHGDALSVEKPISSTSIRVLLPVETRVVGKRLYPGRKDVYDLTVADHHSFFANGILVHNCIQYIAMDVDGIGQYGQTSTSSDYSYTPVAKTTPDWSPWT